MTHGSSEPVHLALRCCNFLPKQSGRYPPGRFHASKKMRFARRLTVVEMTKNKEQAFADETSLAFRLPFDVSVAVQ